MNPVKRSLQFSICLGLTVVLAGCGGSSDDEFGPTRDAVLSQHKSARPAQSEPPQSVDTPEGGLQSPTVEGTGSNPQVAKMPGQSGRQEAQTPNTPQGSGLKIGINQGDPKSVDTAANAPIEATSTGIELVEQPETELSDELAVLLKLRGQVSTDGTAERIVLASDESPVAMYDIELRRVVKSLFGNVGEASAVAVHSNNSMVAVGTSEGKLKIWSPTAIEESDFFTTQAAAREEAATPVIEAHNGPIRVLEFVGERQLLSAGDDGIVRLWNVPFSESEELWASDIAIDDVMEVGSTGLIAVRGPRNKLAIISRTDGRPKADVTLLSEKDSVLAVSPDGTMVAAADPDGLVTVYRVDDGRVRGQWKHSGANLTSLGIDSTTGKVFASTADGELLVWQVDLAETINTNLPAVIETGTEIAADSGRLLGLVAVPEAAEIEKAAIAEAGTTANSEGPPETVAATDNATDLAVISYQLVTLSAEGIVRLRQLDGSVIREWKGIPVQSASARLVPHSRQVMIASSSTQEEVGNAAITISLDSAEYARTVVESPILLTTTTDADSIWVAHETGEIQRLRITDGTVLDTYKVGSLPRALLAEGPSVIAITNGGKASRLTSRLSQAIAAHRSPVTAASISSDGKLIVTGGADGQVLVWDAASGTPVSQKRRLLDGSVTAIEILDKQREFAAAYEKGPICFWRLNPSASKTDVEESPADAGSNSSGLGGVQLGQPKPAAGNQAPKEDPGDEPIRLIENRRLILSMIAIEDGSKLVTGGDERSIVVWNSKTTEQVRTFPGHQAAVLGIWPSDNSQLVSIDQQYEIKNWQLGTVAPVSFQSRQKNQIPLLEIQAARDITAMGEGEEATLEAAQQLRHAKNGDARDKLRGNLAGTSQPVTSASESSPIEIASLAFDDIKPPPASNRPQSSLKPEIQIAFSEDGNTLAAAISWPNRASNQPPQTNVRVWDVPSQIELRRWSGFTTEITDLGVTNDGRFVWTSHKLNSTQRAQVQRFKQAPPTANQQVRSEPLPQEGIHSLEISTGRRAFAEWPVSTVDFDADESRLLLGLIGSEGTTGPAVALLDVATLELNAKYEAFEAFVPAAMFIPESDWAIVSIRERNETRLLTLNRQTLVIENELHAESLDQPWLNAGGAVTSSDLGFNQLFPSSNGRGMISQGRFGGTGYMSIIWNQGTQRFTPSSKTPLDAPAKKALILEQDEEGPTAGWTNPGAQFAVRTKTGFNVVDVRSNELKRRVEIPQFSSRTKPRFAFVPDGRGVLMAEVSGNAVYINLRLDKQPRQFEAHLGPMLAVTFSGNQEFAATAGEEGRIKVWRIAKWLVARQP